MIRMLRQLGRRRSDGHVVTNGKLGSDGGRDPRRRFARPQVRQIIDREPDTCGLKRAKDGYSCFRIGAGGQVLLNFPEASLRQSAFAR